MLPKNLRIERKDYPKTQANKRFLGSFLSLFVYENNPIAKDFSKFSVSISKKVAKSAVVRNRFRRLVYREVSLLKDMIKYGFVCRFVVNSIPKTEKEREDFVVDIKNLMEKSAILKSRCNNKDSLK